MFTNPYSGNFDMWQGVQNLAPLVMQYFLMQELMKKNGGEGNGEYAQGMASMMPNRGLMGQGQPMTGATASPMTRQMPNLPQQAPPSLQGQPFSPGGQGADTGRLQQMMQMKQMMGNQQSPAPVQMPEQGGGLSGIMAILPLLLKLMSQGAVPSGAAATGTGGGASGIASFL